MSGLRPKVRLTAPDGREWELYAYRVRPKPEEGRFRRSRRLFARRAEEWTIEAASWAPYPIAIRWTTSSERRGQVLAQVEGQIAHGEHPVPRNAKLVL